MRFGWSKKVFPDFDPYGGLSFYDCAFGLLASPTFLELPRVAGVRSRVDFIFVIVTPSTVFATGGVELTSLASMA